MIPRLLPRALFALALLVFGSPLRAQFPGDLFLEPRSMGVQRGGSVVFDVLLFSGAERFGSADGAFVYDPQALQVALACGRSCPSRNHRVVAVAVLYVHISGALTRGADRSGPSG